MLRMKEDPHQQDVGHDGPVHGQERLSEEDEDLRWSKQGTRHTDSSNLNISTV